MIHYVHDTGVINATTIFAVKVTDMMLIFTGLSFVFTPDNQPFDLYCDHIDCSSAQSWCQPADFSSQSQLSSLTSHFNNKLWLYI